MICPAYSYGFNKTFLEGINLNENDYKYGNWLGNSTLEERLVFKLVTFDIESGLLKSIISVSCIINKEM